MSDAAQRREALKAVYEQASGCTRCPQLAATRHSVVFGAGNADADLMFVGEAPGRHEDLQGRPFVGAAGKLLGQLVEGIGLRREDVFLANTLKCLRYHAQVELADGTWEGIGRLVRSRYDGRVMSVDEEGRLVPRRVVGWHATPLAGRSVHRLTYRSAEAAGLGRAGIELTGDHPVLTKRGYVRVDRLVEGDRIATGRGLSPLARDVVCGTLLGDGSIARKSAYDEIDVEDVTDQRRGDTTFFCLDVEGTHNFVTAGGVVHNCRPPQNRDPLPQEIDNCQDYLFRQLELIEPRVVCTLGNFATKLLRADPTSIMLLRGREEVRTIGPRTVRLYPLLHPAAALYTRRLLDTLREDFARLPDLLALDPPPQPASAVEEAPVVPEPELAAPEEKPGAEPEPPPQLGLF